MFKDNKYSHVYYSIIERAKHRLHIDVKERHHIIPKSLGGTNKKENIVNLTPREHFICHLLLTKMVSEPKAKRSMNYAFWRMVTQTSHPSQTRNYRITSKMFELARKQLQGKPHTEETKQKLREYASGRVRSQESKLKQSKTTKGLSKSSEHRSKISLGSKERWKNNRPQSITCEHCGTTSIPGNYTRWHGNNCRFKKL